MVVAREAAGDAKKVARRPWAGKGVGTKFLRDRIVPLREVIALDLGLPDIAAATLSALVKGEPAPVSGHGTEDDQSQEASEAELEAAQ